MAPEPKPATAVTILKIEPGTYRPSVARGRSGWLASSWRPSKVALAVSGFAMPDASYVGVDASARTSPVDGSSITTAPRRLPSAATAAFWRSHDNDRVRSFGSYRSAPNFASASLTGSPPSPVSSASYARSSPARPYVDDAYPTTWLICDPA